MGLKDSRSLVLLDLSSWLLGQGSDGARKASTRGKPQVDRGEALVSLSPLGSVRL